jgi:TonB-linked SusC/RagA family outer membrane protein
MRISCLLSIIGLLHIASAARGQITLKEKNAPLEKVLSAIEKQTKYVFLYDPGELKIAPITIELKNATLQETLEKCFKDHPIEWSLVGNNVLLKRTLTENKPPQSPLIVHGKVTDETGQPLQAVTIVNTHTKTTTQTDSTGAYTMPGTKGDVLIFTFVGYSSRHVTIANQPSIDLGLDPNPSAPEQAVVVGYGSSRKRDLTGSVSIIDTKGMDEITFNTFDNALAGKAAGVDVTKTDGTPGGMVRIRIRGASSFLGGNDPLYVIDGVPVQIRNNFIEPSYFVRSPNANLAGANPQLIDNVVALPGAFVNSLNSLGGLNPDDIESITVLKDASSAAIYGSKASNGVVIITTRTGKNNLLPKIEASWSSNVSTPYRTPKLLNASQYKMLLTEAAVNTFHDDSLGSSNYVDDITDSVINHPNFFGTANTNWVKEVTRTTLSNRIGLSIAGGGPASKYFASIAYNNTPGVVDNTDFRRISGKLNVESRIGPKLRFAANGLAGFTDQNIGVGTYPQALLARPDLAPVDASGNFTDFVEKNGPGEAPHGLMNPAAMATATNNARTFNLLGSISASYTIIKDLTFKSAVSLNRQEYNQLNFFPHYIAIDIRPVYPSYSDGVGSQANSRFTDWFLENTLTVHKQFGKENKADLVIGQSYESTKYGYFTTSAAGYPNDNFSSLSSADTILNVTRDEPKGPQSYLLSFFARTNYSYRDKYFLTFTGRADGSSKFGSDKFSYFPSGAIAWRLSREPFLRSVQWLSDLKLRASYGLTGNQNIGDQTKHTLYTSISYAGNNGLIPTVLGNERIKPEITKEGDLGLDLSVFADRLYATVDYYHRQTGNAILSLPITQSSTYPGLIENGAAIRNQGFEASIGGDIIRGRDFKWSASINMTWNRSMVTKLRADADLSQIISPSGFENVGNNTLLANGFYGNTTLFQGKPLGLITGSFVTGIVKTQAEADAYGQAAAWREVPVQIGDPMFKLDTPDAYGYRIPLSNVILGKGSPNYTGGMTQAISYKNFDLQCFFTFSQGGHLAWAEHNASVEFYSLANATTSILDRYTPTHPNTNAPRLSMNNSLGSPTNLDVFSSSYFKLRSLTLGYRIRNIRLFGSATNVFTITKYPGSDPETSDDAYSLGGGYIDAGNYPSVRTFTLGIKAVF